MSDAEQILIDDLVDRWESEVSHRRKITPHELCSDHPELLERVTEVISALEWVRGKRAALFQLDTAGDGLRGKRAVGRFELQHVIGAGSFGTVWRAYDPELQRFVALKIQNPTWTNEKQQEAFIAEARLLSKLNHPNIVHVHEVCRDDDQVYFVTELVEGSNLSEVLETKPLPRKKQLELLCQIADALDFAHEKGIIHRDIKPSNILIANVGMAKVCDFGIAITSDRGHSDYRGTLAYMSPEQLSGQKIDKQSDLYSFGVVALELLSRQSVLERDSKAEYPATLKDDLIDDLPKSLRNTFRRALSQKPEERFPTAKQFVKSLQLAPSRRIVLQTALVVVSIAAVWHLNPWQWLRIQYLQSTRPEPIYSLSFDEAGSVFSNEAKGASPLDAKLLGPFRVVADSNQPDAKATRRHTNRIGFLEAATNSAAAGLSIDKKCLTSQDGFTVSFWFKAESISERSTLFHIGEASGYANQLAPQITIWLSRDGVLNVLSYWRYREITAKRPELDHNVEIGPCVGQWRHFAVTFQPTRSDLANSGVFRLYIDGKPVIEREKTRLYLMLNHSKARLTIGRTLKSPDKGQSNGFVGEIRDVKIWDWALPAGHVRSTFTTSSR